MAIASDETTTLSLKIPPHSLEAEQSVLGGLMLDENAWDRLESIITADDFYGADAFRVLADFLR